MTAFFYRVFQLFLYIILIESKYEDIKKKTNHAYFN